MSYQKSLAALFVLFPCLTAAFLIQPNTQPFPPNTNMMMMAGSTPFKNRHPSRGKVLNMAEESSTGERSSSPQQKRTRSKRKEESSSAEPFLSATPLTAPAVELKPRDDSPVQMQVMDVRDIMGGGAPKSTSAGSNNKGSSANHRAVAAASEKSSPASASFSSSLSVDDSLQQLLEDAKMMQRQSDLEGEESSAAGAGNLKTTIRNALSNLVTADFFVVCAFLLWFLAGIFCSSVLKDDTVQIAFNSNFQAFVQPALGLLMIASVAGSFFQEDEDGVGGDR